MMDEYENEEIGGEEDQNLEGTLQGLSSALTELTNPSTTEEALEESRRILAEYRQKDPEEAAIGEQMKRRSEETRAILRRARERLAARKFDKSQLWLAAAQGLGAPTKTGAFSESVANLAGQLAPVRKEQRAFQYGQEEGLTELDQALGSVDDAQLQMRLKLLMERQKNKASLAKDALKNMGKRVAGAQGAQAAVDKTYAKDYVEFIQSGASDAAKALEELDIAATRLDKATKGTGPNQTGPVIGSLSTLPVIGKPIQDIAFSDSADTQELVESTVQRSLRPILGAQFTAQEGERLISRVYNPRLSDAVNASRVRRLKEQLARAYEQKQRAAAYFEKNGTLRGFKGKTSWTINDFYPAGGETDTAEDDTSDLTDVADETSEDNSADAETITPLSEIRGKRKFRMPWDLRFAEGGEVDSEGGETRVIRINGELVEIPAEMTNDEALAQYQEATSGSDIATTAAESGVGAAAGYGAGRYGSNLAMSAFDKLPGRRIKPGEKRVLDLMDWADATPEDIAKRLRDLQKRQVPAAMIDVAGPEIRSLGEASLLPKAKGTTPFIDSMKARQKDTRNRVVEQVNRGLAPDSYQELLTKLEKTRKDRGDQLYTPLWSQFPDVKSRKIHEVLSTAEGQSAVKAAREHWKTDPKTRKLPMGKADATGMARSYPLQFLDLIKYYYDDEVNKAMKGGATKYAELIKRNRDAFRDELDQLTGGDASPYKAARSQWEYDSRLEEAAKFGHDDYLKLSPGEAQKYIKDLDFTQRDVLRSGVAESLMRQLQGPYTDSNPAQKIVGSPDTLAKLELLFDKPKDFEVFKAALEAEREMFDETRGTLNKGKASRGQYEPPQSKIRKRIQEDAPALGVFSPTYWILRRLRKEQTLGEKEADQILTILQTKDPKYIEQKLGSKFRRKQKRKARAGKAGLLTAAIGAAAPVLMQNRSEAEVEDPDWEDLTPEQIKASTSKPAYAKGGSVKDRLARLKEKARA